MVNENGSDSGSVERKMARLAALVGLGGSLPSPRLRISPGGVPVVVRRWPSDVVLEGGLSGLEPDDGLRAEQAGALEEVCQRMREGMLLD